LEYNFFWISEKNYCIALFIVTQEGNRLLDDFQNIFRRKQK